MKHIRTAYLLAACGLAIVLGVAAAYYLAPHIGTEELPEDTIDFRIPPDSKSRR